MSRRLRLIWLKLWLIPLVGATADVVAGEAAKLADVTVPIPWLFSAIGVVGMLGAAVVRAYSVPLIPEGLETPDEALTRRSRILGERLGATPVRVFVSDLPKLRGKVDTYLDGHDLFVSERVAALPEAQRDFLLAQVLVARGSRGAFRQRMVTHLCTLLSLYVVLGAAVLGLKDATARDWATIILMLLQIGLFAWEFWLLSVEKARWGPAEDRTDEVFALKATGQLTAAISALGAFAISGEEKKQAALDANALERWWNTKGQKAVEASEWYQRERSLAAKELPLTE